MITCRDAQHLFDRYLDGELTPQMQAELHAHRLNCSSCQMELALMEACGDVVGLDKREPVLSTGFTNRVMLAYRSQNLRRQRSWRRIAAWTMVPTAAAACLALAVIWQMLPAAPQADPAAAPRMTVVAGGAREGAVVAVPDQVKRILIESNRTRLTPEEQRELNSIPQMSVAGFMNSLLTPLARQAQDTLDHARRGAEDLQVLVRAGLIRPDMKSADANSTVQPEETLDSDLSDLPGAAEELTPFLFSRPDPARLPAARSPEAL